MTIVDMSHPRIQAYIKALKDYEEDVYAPSGPKNPAYGAVVDTEMKLTRFEVRAVHEYLAKEGE